jgi:hypothetical protein
MIARLGADTVLTLVRLRHGEPHPVLAHTPVWRDDTASRAEDARAHAELTRLGLMRGDRLVPEFDDMVGALVRPDHELYGWIDTVVAGRPRRFSVLAGSAHQTGFLLVQDHEPGTVTLTALDPDDLLDAFLAQLPPKRPANRPGITVTHDEFLATRPGVRRRSAPPRLLALQALVDQPRSGAGSLYAAVRRGVGTRVRVPRPVTYIDTRDGRWLITHHTRDGHRWTRVRPATPHLIAGRLRVDNGGAKRDFVSSVAGG